MTSQQNYTLFLDTNLDNPQYEVFCERCKEGVGHIISPDALDDGEAEGRSVGLSYSAYPLDDIGVTVWRVDMEYVEEQAQSFMNAHVCSDYIVSFQSNLLSGKLRQHMSLGKPHKGGGVRGEVQGFSKASQMRARRALAKYDRGVVSQGLFITLTYPADYPDGRKAKRDFKVFSERLKRKYPQAGVFWRMEAQKRGAPHYHLLIFGLGFIPAQWIAHAWYEVCNTGDEKHLQAGTEIRKVKNYMHAVDYISKYMTKVQEEVMGDDWGRMWGQLGAWRDYLHEVRQVRLSRSQYVQLLRLVDSLRAARVRMSNRYRKEKGLPLRRPYKGKRERYLASSGGWFLNADEVWDNLAALVGLTFPQLEKMYGA